MPTKNLQPLRFDEAYAVCGGCMHLLQTTYVCYVASSGFVKPHQMSFVALRRGIFTQALLHPTDWKENDLLFVMQKMISSDSHSVGYHELCTKLGKESVNALIQNNLIHLRPCSGFDLDDTLKYPIVTPHLPCDVLIMEELLEDVD